MANVVNLKTGVNSPKVLSVATSLVERHLSLFSTTMGQSSFSRGHVRLGLVLSYVSSRSSWSFVSA